MDRVAVATYGVLLAVVVSGLAIFGWPVGGPGYFGLIGLHQWIALALLVLAPWGLGRHLAKTNSAPWSSGGAVAVGGLLAIPIPYLLVMPEEQHDRGPWGFLLDSLFALSEGDMGAAYPAIAGLSLLALVTLATLITLVGLTSRVVEREASRRTGLALTLLVAWAWFSGFLLFFEGVFTLRSGQMFHSFSGCWTAGVLLVHLAAKRAAETRLPRTAVAAFGLLWLVAFGVLWGLWTQAQGRQMDLATYTTPASVEERRQLLDPHSAWGRAPSELLSGSSSCGSSGCHERVFEQWQESGHSSASSNPLYRAAVDDLVRTRGMEDAVACATCHDPVRALSGTVATAYKGGVPSEGEGVNCVSCHAISGAKTYPAGNGQYDIELEMSYPTDHKARVRAIRRDARRHQVSFAESEAIYTNASCRVCHRVEHHGHVLQEADLPGADDPNPSMECRVCHLPPDGATTYSHQMSGRALGTPAVPIEQSIPGTAGGSLGRMDIKAVYEGDILRVEIVTYRGVRGHDGHSFPSGPVDLQQVWLELRAFDTTSQSLLAHIGTLDGDGRIAGAPPRMGAVARDASGTPIEKHRVLDVVDVTERRSVRSDRPPQRDVVEIPLPSDHRGPIEIRARWLHRRTPPDFARWALGEGHKPLPPTSLTGTKLVIERSP